MKHSLNVSSIRSSFSVTKIILRRIQNIEGNNLGHKLIFYPSRLG